jgi:phosphatidylglycerophosphate synthase
VAPHWRIPAVLFAALSDLMDGLLGRYLGATGRLGRILDPVADKVFILGVIVTLLSEGRLALWEVALIGLRDVAVLVGAAWLLFQRRWQALGNVPPSLWGKATTVLQFAFLLSLLFFGRSLLPLFVATAVVSGIAALDYTRRYFQRPSQGPRE